MDIWPKKILDEPRLAVLEEFKLELETWERKKGQLETIVQHLRSLEGKAKHSFPADLKRNRMSRFVCKEPPESWQWNRSPRLQDEDWPVYKDISTLNLHIVVLTWRNKLLPAVYDSISNQPPQSTDPALFFPRPTRPFGAVSMSTITYMTLRSVMQAEAVEQTWRERFERLMGELEAKKWMEKWKKEGSLLKLEHKRDIPMSTATAGDRETLSWLNNFRM